MTKWAPDTSDSSTVSVGIQGAAQVADRLTETVHVENEVHFPSTEHCTLIPGKIHLKLEREVVKFQSSREG